VQRQSDSGEEDRKDQALNHGLSSSASR
jgi:hypothetical protein